MSNVLRSAVAAVTLFTCPACVTTGSTPNLIDDHPPTTTPTTTPATSATKAEAVGAIGAAIATPPTSASASPTTPAPASAGSASPSASALRSGGASPLPQSTPRVTVPINFTSNSADATTATLAWEQSRSGLTSLSSGNPNLLFEPSDSGLRIVMNVLDLAKPTDRVPLNASVGTGASVSEARAALARIGSDAALLAPLPEAPPEPIEMPTPPKEPLDAPIEGSGSRIDAPLPEPQATPEPTALALAVFGLVMIGWRIRRSIR